MTNPETPVATPTPRNLVRSIRASLLAKLERMLSRPIIASIVGAEPKAEIDAEDDTPGVFRALQQASRRFTPAAGATARYTNPRREDPEDGSYSVRISLDYDDLWRGCEKEIVDTATSTIESAITFLTNEQRLLLERSPREFLELRPRPATAELIFFECEVIGGSTRIVELKFEAPPESRAQIRHIAIVPNLVQIERQLDALQKIESATDESPQAPLRALLGICDPSGLQMTTSTEGEIESPASDERFDEYQIECIRKALATPHFAVIQGPPGSGKTTVIGAIIRRALARGDRVLVVSPTHVAVDNVVEKLAPRGDSKAEDVLEERSIPVRYAARNKRLSDHAMEYWVGKKGQRRGATISRRIQRRLCETVPFAEALYAMEDVDALGHAPLSAAVARVEAVICGTPIGILSYESVKNADPGSYGLLIVDEVSKMTLPEFLAIAVKARRWVLVGDPEQLPPYNNAEENATTLDDVIEPLMELVCSVGAILERARPAVRCSERLVVVTSDPSRAAAAIRVHLRALLSDCTPFVGMLEETRVANTGIVVCSPTESDAACALLSPMRVRDRDQDPNSSGSVRILVERGIRLRRPDYASGTRFVEARERAQTRIFETSFNVYHSQPWSERSGQKLRVVAFRNGLEKYLPSAAALDSLNDVTGTDLSPVVCRGALIDVIAERFAINTISVYDWLTGIPATHLDTSPLRELDALSPAALSEAVQPFVGTLKKQYRMHASLSLVPRELFYFGDALHDGRRDEKASCRVNLLQVVGEGDEGESNGAETEAISTLLEDLNSDDAARERPPGIMIITPYRKQEERLGDAVSDLRERGVIDNLEVEVCTLDRCQGREAEYVLISLVKGRATPFLDMPKRWNVALTRAMRGLFIVGNIDAYLGEAAMARRDPRAQPSASKRGRIMMSLLARIIEAYDRQIAARRQQVAL